MKKFLLLTSMTMLTAGTFGCQACDWMVRRGAYMDPCAPDVMTEPCAPCPCGGPAVPGVEMGGAVPMPVPIAGPPGVSLPAPALAPAPIAIPAPVQ
jgi:hypothetical protein